MNISLSHNSPRLLFIVNVDWFFLSHRLPIALEAKRQGFDVHVATAFTDKKDELKEYGFILHQMPADRGKMGVGSLFSSLWFLFRLIQTVQPDLVHLVTIKPVLLGGLAARLLRVPGVVAAISGLGAVFLAEGFWGKVRRFFVKQIYGLALKQNRLKVIFQNRDDEKMISSLVSLNAKESCLIQGGSGVDLSVYQSHPLQEGRPIVMFAARLLKDKGLKEFIDAVAWLNKRERLGSLEPRFVLVGQIDLENPASFTQTEIEQIERDGQIEVWGYQSDMQNVLSQAHIVVLPSYREGFPKVLIEAAACGRAVITTDVPGCRDAVLDGETGILVGVKSSVALAEGIERLLLSPDLVKTMGEQGRQLAVSLFDIKQVVAQHMQIYEDLLAQIKSSN